MKSNHLSTHWHSPLPPFPQWRRPGSGTCRQDSCGLPAEDRPWEGGEVSIWPHPGAANTGDRRRHHGILARVCRGAGCAAGTLTPAQPLWGTA